MAKLKKIYCVVSVNSQNIRWILKSDCDIKFGFDLFRRKDI